MSKSKRSEPREIAPDADEADEALDRQETAEARRALFAAFQLWTICPHKECRRAKACRGDTEECCRERWSEAVPDELRALVAKVARLCAEGHSVEDAVRLAEADMRAHAAALAEIEARQARQRTVSAPVKAADEVRTVPEDRAPRIRGL